MELHTLLEETISQCELLGKFKESNRIKIFCCFRPSLQRLILKYVFSSWGVEQSYGSNIKYWVRTLKSFNTLSSIIYSRCEKSSFFCPVVCKLLGNSVGRKWLLQDSKRAQWKWDRISCLWHLACGPQDFEALIWTLSRWQHVQYIVTSCVVTSYLEVSVMKLDKADVLIRFWAILHKFCVGNKKNESWLQCSLNNYPQKYQTQLHATLAFIIHHILCHF